MHALARDFPDVGFALNGGVTTLAEAAAIARGDGAEAYEGREFGRADEGRELEALPRGALVGCMVGRAAHADPWGVLATADTDVFGEATNPRASRRELLARYAEYADAAAGATRNHEGRVRRAQPAPPDAPAAECVRGGTKRETVAEERWTRR